MGLLRRLTGPSPGEMVAKTLLARETPEPIEGTTQSLWPSIADFWDETFSTTSQYISPAMADKVWVANRCIQLNSQQIASMPLRFTGAYEPLWVTNPDPAWYPNGIADAVFAMVRSIYGWGFAILYVTSRYASGMPQSFTVVDPNTVVITMERGRRAYKANEQNLDPRDVVQIDRNPGFGLHGTSAIRASAVQAWGLLAASELGRSVMTGGTPKAVLKSERKLTKAQAEALQSQWVARVSERGGAPPVLPPEISFETLSFSPKDLLLLDGLEFNVRALAAAFGVPASLLNMAVTGGLTYQNPAMLGEQWWRFELLPTADRIARSLTSQMLPRGAQVRFDASATFSPLDEEDEGVVSPAAQATPADQNGAVTPLRPTIGVMA